LIINELDAIRQKTGVTTLAAYHVTKQAMRDGGELRAGASSGSLQLEDLSRWVLNLKALNSKEAINYGLDTVGLRYVEAAVTKTNYTPPLSTPLIWQRCDGGALSYIKAKSVAENEEERVFNVLCEAVSWITRDELENKVKELHDIGKNRAVAARTRLENAGRVTRHEVREGRKSKCVFAPSEDYRRVMEWPEPPGKLDEIEGL
jgi:hypothetical protein